MSEKNNEKLILKPTQTELYLPQDFKVSPNLIQNPLWDSLLEDQKEGSMIAGIHYNGSVNSVSYINNEAIYSNINALRTSSPSYITILENDTSDMLESIPQKLNMTKTVENLERMFQEYSFKSGTLDFISDNFYDPNYATNMWMAARSTQVIPVNGRLDSSNILLSGYIKVEDASSDIQLNLIFRGIPIPMRKTKTSKNTDGTFNYIFTYPQYLLEGNIDLVQAINHIEILNQGDALFFYGNEYYFEVTNFSGYENKLANLHIVNKSARNLISQTEIPAE